MSTDTKTVGIEEIPMDATDLTQLSSREQLSALMDGALPADETRFLLRRLQHDGSLAECWERWRLSAEVMRGLAPAQRLPADFASRVAASLRGEEAAINARAPVMRTPAWLRWGGGAAVAASLAVVALMNQPLSVQSPGNLPDHAVVAATGTAASLANSDVAFADTPIPQLPPPQAPEQDPAGESLESQTAALASVAAIAAARPSRGNRRASPPLVMQAATASPMVDVESTESAEAAMVAVNDISPLPPPTDIITRPWPRSVLPHADNSGITVGFGSHTRNGMPASRNPFPLRTGIGSLPPTLIVEPDSGAATPPVNDAPGRTTGSEPQS